MSNGSIWKQEGSKNTILTILIATLITIIATLILNPFDFNFTDSAITGSKIIPFWALTIFRTLVAIGGILTIVYIVSFVKRDALLYNTTSKEFENIQFAGLWRLSTFTSWCFAGLSLAFTLLAICSWAEILDFSIPHIVLKLTILMFPVIYSSSLFVTIIVTYILIPGTQKSGRPLENWFKIPEQIMHNLNTIVLTMELVFGNIPINFDAFTLVILFGISYIIFAAYNEKRTKIYFYSFLDPRGNRSPLIHIALLAVSLICFVAVFITNLALNRWYLQTTFLLIIGIPFILYVKMPKTIISK